MDEKITRIDLEANGEGSVLVRYWREGWQENDPANASEIVPGYIVGLLMRYEREGFTCEMCDREHGRALRGKITRVDLIQMHDGWHYRKYPFGWTARTKPLVDQIKTEAEVSEIVSWCRARGWHVREWPGGYRAFLGAPLPVRDTRAIMAMRRQVQANLAAGRADGTNKGQYDLALDW